MPRVSSLERDQEHRFPLTAVIPTFKEDPLRVLPWSALAVTCARVRVDRDGLADRVAVVQEDNAVRADTPEPARREDVPSTRTGMWRSL